MEKKSRVEIRFPFLGNVSWAPHHSQSFASSSFPCLSLSSPLFIFIHFPWLCPLQFNPIISTPFVLFPFIWLKEKKKNKICKNLSDLAENNMPLILNAFFHIPFFLLFLIKFIWIYFYSLRSCFFLPPFQIKVQK